MVHRRAVIVTVDVMSIPRSMRDRVEKAVLSRWRLPPEALVLNASHTHCGPELRAGKASLYGLAAARVRQSHEYTAGLEDKLILLIGRGLRSLTPRSSCLYSRSRHGRRFSDCQGKQSSMPARSRS